MSECVYQNYPGERKQVEEEAGEADEVEERTVIIYESAENHRSQNSTLNTMGAVTQSSLHQQSGRTFFRVVIVCLGLLCILLLAGLIGTILHCRTQKRSSTDTRQPFLSPVKLNRFCKDGCTSFNNSLYYSSSTLKSWEDSRQDCKDRGADLVVVDSEEEQVFINTLNLKLWIGLSHGQEGGTWKWVDGSALNSTGFWKTGPPSGTFRGRKKDCVSLDTSWSPQLNSWIDVNCDANRQWICEILTQPD